MFTADISNRVPSSLFPKVVGQHSRALYTLDTAIGTISQVDTRTFDKAFNGMGRYPSAQQVSSVCRVQRVLFVEAALDHEPYGEGKGSDGDSCCYPHSVVPGLCR